MKNFLTNWKTTAAGVAIVIHVLSNFLGTHTLTTEDYGNLTIAFGLIFAKDGNVTGGTKQQ